MTVKSANLDFFAAENDQRAVLDFLFSDTDIRVFESYSLFDQDLREFRSTEEIAAGFNLGIDQHGNGAAILLQLWSPSVFDKLTITRISLDAARCNGHTYRYRIDGGALMQLYLGGAHERIVTHSHFGHQSETRAQTWGVGDGINWKSLKTISNRIQYHLRTRLAVAKAASCPVMQQALELSRSGYEPKLAAQTPWAYEVRPATEK
jgi:hypothetical protein